MSSQHPSAHDNHCVLSSVLIISFLVCVIVQVKGANVTIRDFTGRGFQPDLVEYRLKGTVSEGERVQVLKFGKDAVPSQVVKSKDGRDRLFFIASVPSGGSVTYEISNTSSASRVKSRIQVVKEQSALVLRNGLYAVRVPGERQETFKEPTPASSLPAPILGFMNNSGKWLGKGQILSKRKVREFSVRLTAEGPAFAELTYELQWAEGGYYRAILRVIDQVPMVKVREEYDMKKLDGTQFWELDLGKGWEPDTMETASDHGNGGGDPKGRLVPLTQFEKQPVQYLVGDQAWGKLSHIGLFRKDEMKTLPDKCPLVCVVPMRKGAWRRSNAIEARSDKAGDFRIRLPMGVRYAIWSKDITSETSPFSTQEHEMALPKTYGRRVWGLGLNHPPVAWKVKERPCYQLRNLYAIISLNEYKDYILEWTAGKVTYPRLFANWQGGDKYRKALAEAKYLDRLPRNTYLATGDEKVAKDNLRKLQVALKQKCMAYFSRVHASHHGNCQNYTIATLADDVLSWPELPEEDRCDIRSRIALLTYVYEDANMMSYANGHHHGNPNMGTARFGSGPCFMALLPDHPMYEKWRRHMDHYADYLMSTQVAPGGGYLEYGAAYHMHGYSRITNGLRGLISARAPLVPGMEKHYVIPDWSYYMNLLTPFDSRWQSRIIPGMANSPPGNTEHLIEAAAVIAPYDPALAANLAWAWIDNGAKSTELSLADPSVKPAKPELTSQLYPGVGVIFRAHQGLDETYMFMRCGFNWSHWYVDPGHFIFYSRGASLTPFQPYQYGSPKDKGFDAYNTIRFGDKENIWPHGWGDSNIIDHMFGSHVDYAWASTGFPDWFIDPGISPTWQETANVSGGQKRKLDPAFKQTQGAFEWNRQVLFLKGKTANSPNYFVVRDTMPGKGKLASYLNLNLLGTKQDVTVQGSNMMINTQWPVKLDVRFLTPGKLQPAMYEENFPVATYNSNLRGRVKGVTKASPNWVDKKGQPIKKVPSRGIFEKHVLLRLPAEPGEGYFWLLYPRKSDEPEPRVARLKEGVLKVIHPEGTDYIFMTPHSMNVTVEDVVFAGNAGAVRIGKDAVTFALAGGGGRIGYKGHIVESNHSFEKTIKLSGLSKGSDKMPDVKSSLPTPDYGNTKGAELAPGIREIKQGEGEVQYLLRSDEYVVFEKAGIHLEGNAALIEVAPGKVRFVASAQSYVKLSVGNRGVRGFGPFDLTFTDDGIKGRLDGKKRSLAVTWPDKITRPMYRMDGVRYYAGWADDHSIGKGDKTPQFSMGFGVTEGPHTIAISEYVYPELPTKPEQRAITLR